MSGRFKNLVRASFDFSPFAREVRKLRASLSAEIPDRLAKSFDAFLGTLESPGEIVSADLSDRPAADASKLRIRLKAGKGLTDIAATAAALERELLLFKNRRHDGLLGRSRSPKVMRAGGRVKRGALPQRSKGRAS